MPYLIQTRDHPDKTEIRETLREEHRRHIVNQGEKILAAGAILADDGVGVVGGMTILDTDKRSEAEHYAANDPYAIAGVHAQTIIARWRKRWWEGSFLAPNASGNP